MEKVTLINIKNGMLVLYKRAVGPSTAAEIWVHPEQIAAIEPHRNGCYVYAAGQRWDVECSHVELAQTIADLRRH